MPLRPVGSDTPWTRTTPAALKQPARRRAVGRPELPHVAVENTRGESLIVTVGNKTIWETMRADGRNVAIA
jgi:hypothetical protein